MRTKLILAVIVMFLGFVLASEASAESRKRCQQMTRQIRQFYQVLKTAEEREDAMWAHSTRSHIAHLEGRRLSQCPRYMAREEHIAAQIQHEENVEKMKAMMKIAAEAAMKYYTGGLY